MYKFIYSAGPDNFVKDSDSTSFVELWKMRWDELHEESGIFRYKIGNLQEKIVASKYLLQVRALSIILLFEHHSHTILTIKQFTFDKLNKTYDSYG